jgi:hypothetical protein
MIPQSFNEAFEGIGKDCVLTGGGAAAVDLPEKLPANPKSEGVKRKVSKKKG